MISWSVPNLKPGWWLVICRGWSPLAVIMVWMWSHIGRQWSAAGGGTDWSEKATGLNSITLSWASRDLAGKPRTGGQYYLYSPVSGSGCTAKLGTHTHTEIHTCPCTCACMCSSRSNCCVPASELQRGLCTCSLLAQQPEQPCSHQSYIKLSLKIQVYPYFYW